MRNTVLITLMLFSYWAIVCQSASDFEALRYLKEVEWPRAYHNQDTELLDRILAEEFQLIAGDGSVTTKEDELAYIKAFKSTHDSFQFEIKRLEIFENNSAIISGRGHIRGKDEKGSYSAIYASSNVLIKRGDLWKAISSHVSGYHKVYVEEDYTALFNGFDLDGWTGNKDAYKVKNGVIVIEPESGGSGGNLYTSEEYEDFSFKFEFKLTPGANNGLGIHTPLNGDAAYDGKEIQILDNTAEKYARLKPYQYHGSVYGIAPAKRGFLKPVGEWNQEEVFVKDGHIKVTLNGNIIVDVQLEEVTKNGTIDGREHPGLSKNKGHIAFCGHGDVVHFRNIRIKKL